MPHRHHSIAWVFPPHAPEEYPVYGNYQSDETGDLGGEQAGGSKSHPE
jgi:hypothetical protein